MAFHAIKRLGVVLSVSPIYRSAAVGGPSRQPDYLNAVLSLATYLNPQELLVELLTIEQLQGRQRNIRWEARTLDLDLLAYENFILNTDRLILPHPRLLERSFVLLPLYDIEPSWQHPISQEPLEVSLSKLRAVGLGDIEKTSLEWIER